MIVVKEYFGKGLFRFTSHIQNFNVTDLNFIIRQYSDAKIEIICQPPFLALPHIINLMQFLKVSIEGDIDSKGHVNIKEASISTFKLNGENNQFSVNLTLKVFEPVKIVFKDKKTKNIKISLGLTNFLFENCEENDERGILANLENFSIFLKPHENYNDYYKLLNDSKETKLVTAEAIIESKCKNLNFVEIFENLGYMLSFASGTLVSPIYEDYYDEEEIFKTILKPFFTTNFKKGHQLITGSGCNIKNFLEMSFYNYSKFSHKYGLNIVITFYLSGIRQEYLDIRFLLLVTALETLLEGYAETRELEENPIQKHLYEKNRKHTIKILNKFNIENHEKIADLIVEKVSYSHLTIPDKLNALIKDEKHEIKLDKFDRDFITIRNKIAHTGKVPETINSSGTERDIDIRDEFNRLNHLLDRLILRILNYKGNPFINRINNETTELD